MCVLNTLLLLLCGVLAVIDHGGPLFLAVAGVCVIFICSVREWFFPSRGELRLSVSLARTIEVGALVGFCAWVVMMFLVSTLSQPGDKVGSYVVFVSQGPVILGALAGGIARYINYRRRIKGLLC